MTNTASDVTAADLLYVVRRHADTGVGELLHHHFNRLAATGFEQLPTLPEGSDSRTALAAVAVIHQRLAQLVLAMSLELGAVMDSAAEEIGDMDPGNFGE